MYVYLRREYERPNHQLIRAREAHFFIMDIHIIIKDLKARLEKKSLQSEGMFMLELIWFLKSTVLTDSMLTSCTFNDTALSPMTAVGQ